MIKFFITILNMSISATIVILAILVLRLFLKRAPRIFSYALWLVVFLRLLCPFLPEAEWGMIPYARFAQAGAGFDLWKPEMNGQPAERIQLFFADAMEAQGETGGIGTEADGFPKTAEDTVKTARGWMAVIGIYFTGVCLLFLYCLGSLLTTRKRLKSMEIGEEERYGRICRRIVAKGIKAPFVFGIIKPVVYFPQGLSKEQQELVWEHELMHIRRRDHLIKPIAFAGVCLHWFNPFVWAAFHFMESDMELSCDEAVLKKTGYENKKAYADTLLYLSGEPEQMSCPIAFGEKSVKTRIKNIIRLKKAKNYVTAIVAVAVVCAAAVLLVNGKWNLQEEPGTEGTVETYYMYSDELSDETIKAEEINYLPSEQIAHAQDIPTDTEMSVEHMYYPVTPDGHSVLLREKEGAFYDTLIEYTCPVEGSRISDIYGERIHPETQERIMHSGIDFAAEKGTPVKAAAEGTVFETGFDTYCGNYVILQHDNGDMTYYAHCDAIMVETGAKVMQGEQIATVGNTGASTGSYLHFAVSRNGSFVEVEI